MLMKLFTVSRQGIGPLCSIPEPVLGNKAPTGCQEGCLAPVQKGLSRYSVVAWQGGSRMTPGIPGRTTVFELSLPASHKSSWSPAQKPPWINKYSDHCQISRDAGKKKQQ